MDTCIQEFIGCQMLDLRTRLTGNITIAVKGHGGRIDSNWTDGDKDTEYPPTVVSQDPNACNRYGGYEAATLTSLFLREDSLYCVLNGESGEDFEQSIDLVQIEGLLEIVKWLQKTELLVIDESAITVCDECGSADIQTQAWVDPNTRMFIDTTGIDRDDNWCNECEDHLNFCTMKEFRERMRKWWGSTDFNEMERITGYRQVDFSPEDGYQDFVDACNNWWNSKSYDEKRKIWKE